MTELKLEKSYTEKLAKKIAMQLCDGKDRIEYLKIKLGIELILINVGKGAIVYLVAIIFGTLIPTVITHLACVLLRKHSKGLHAKSSTVCVLISILLFVVLPHLMQSIVINRWWTLPIGIITTYLFYKYAPADTEKSPLVDEDVRKHLQYRTVGVNIALHLVALTAVLPMLRTLIILGGVLQVIMVLPITYKLFRRGYNNYEAYETV